MTSNYICMEELTTQELFIYFGIIIAVIAAGFFMYRKEIFFLFKKKEARGIITNWMSTTEKGKKFFYPMIEFETPEFGKITFRADDRCENNPLYPQGTQVRILYYPEDAEMRKIIYPEK